MTDGSDRSLPLSAAVCIDQARELPDPRPQRHYGKMPNSSGVEMRADLLEKRKYNADLLSADVKR